jgi:hypothetical protein
MVVMGEGVVVAILVVIYLFTSKTGGKKYTRARDGKVSRGPSLVIVIIGTTVVVDYEVVNKH